MVGANCFRIVAIGLRRFVVSALHHSHRNR
jgi:hypothetical protein